MTLEPDQPSSSFVSLPLKVFRFCPMCGLNLRLNENQTRQHLSECLICNLEGSEDLRKSNGLLDIGAKEHDDCLSCGKALQCVACRSRVPAAAAAYTCSTCGKEYKMVNQLNKHRFFCEKTVNLSEFEDLGRTAVNSRDELEADTDNAIVKPDARKVGKESSSNVVISNSELLVLPSHFPQELQQEILILPEVPIPTSEKGTIKGSHVDASKIKAALVETKEVPNVCPICKKVFRLSKYLRRHIVKTHGDEKTEICPYCNKGFKDQTSMKNHIRSHTNEKPFSCQLCPKSFRRKDSLIYHENSHKNQRTFICSHCAKSFRNLRDLKNHEKTQHLNNSSGVKYQCKTCGFKFPTRKGLTDHKDLSHGIKALQCRTCRRSFSSAATLQEHERIHLGIKPFQCRFCIKTFRRNSHKMLHEKRHLLSGDFRCTACNKIFPQESELKKHVTNIHSAMKLPCQFCDKSFASEDKLKQHTLKHEVSLGIETEIEPTSSILPTQTSSILQQGLPQTGSLLQQGLQTISVKTEKFKTTDDTITTKTVYVMEPDVPGGSSPPSLITGSSATILGSSYLLGVPQYRSDKEVGATIVIPAGKSSQELQSLDHQSESAGHLTEIRLHQDSSFRF